MESPQTPVSGSQEDTLVNEEHDEGYHGEDQHPQAHEQPNEQLQQKPQEQPQEHSEPVFTVSILAAVAPLLAQDKAEKYGTPAPSRMPAPSAIMDANPWIGKHEPPNAQHQADPSIVNPPRRVLGQPQTDMSILNTPRPMDCQNTAANEETPAPPQIQGSGNLMQRIDRLGKAASQTPSSPPEPLIFAGFRKVSREEVEDDERVLKEECF
jgi:hypothetical protein